MYFTVQRIVQRKKWQVQIINSNILYNGGQTKTILVTLTNGKQDFKYIAAYTWCLGFGGLILATTDCHLYIQWRDTLIDNVIVATFFLCLLKF